MNIDTNWIIADIIGKKENNIYANRKNNTGKQKISFYTKHILRNIIVKNNNSHFYKYFR